MRFLRAFFYFFAVLSLVNLLSAYLLLDEWVWGLDIQLFNQDFVTLWQQVGQTFFYQYNIKFFLLDFGLDRFDQPVALMLMVLLVKSMSIVLPALVLAWLLSVLLFYGVFWFERATAFGVLGVSVLFLGAFYLGILGFSMYVGIAWSTEGLLLLWLLSIFLLKIMLDWRAFFMLLTHDFLLNRLYYQGLSQFRLMCQALLFLRDVSPIYLLEVLLWGVLLQFLMAVFLAFDGLGLYVYQSILASDASVLRTMLFTGTFICLLKSMVRSSTPKCWLDQFIGRQYGI